LSGFAFHLRGYHSSRPVHQQLTADNTRLIVSPESSAAPNLIALINQLQNGAWVLLDGSSISHHGVIAALQSAAHRGVHIEACVDTNRAENKALATIPEIIIHPRDIHTKRTLLFSTDPRESGETNNGVVFFGSENMSNNAGRHVEVHMQSTEKNCVAQHYQDHQLNVLDGQQEKEENSDADLQILNSRQHDLNAATAAAIACPRTLTVKLATMILTDEGIWSALAAQACAGKIVQVLIDKDTRDYPSGKHFIPELVKHGADVRSFSRTGRFQHAKIVSLEQDNEEDEIVEENKKTLDMISSANCTRVGNQQINSTMVVRNNRWFHTEIQTTLEKIANLCASLRQ
jgi:hypothetical protein